MIVEDKILAYLDGSLGEQESEELLETLAVSPEKRALLEEHLRLKDILALGKKAYSVPLETERALAERLPALAGRGKLAPLARTPFSGLTRWMATHPFRTSMGVGAFALLAGLTFFAVRSNIIESTTANTSRNFAATRNNLQVTHQYDVAQSQLQQPDLPINNIHRNLAATNRPQSVQQAPANPTLNSGNEPIQSTSVSNDHSEEASLSSVKSYDQAIAIPGTAIAHTLHEIALGGPAGIHPLSLGVNCLLGAAYLPQLSTLPSPATQFTSPLALTFDWDITPNFAIGLEAGEILRATMVQRVDSSAPVGYTDYSHIFYSSSFTQDIAYYGSITLHYTIAPESDWPIRIGVAPGMTLNGEGTLIGTIGVSRVLTSSLVFDMNLTAGRIFGTPVQSTSSTSTNGIVGTVHNNGFAPTTYTSLVGLRAGLRYRI